MKRTIVPRRRRRPHPSHLPGWLLAPTLTHCLGFRLSGETKHMTAAAAAAAGAPLVRRLCARRDSRAAASWIRPNCHVRRAVTEPQLKAFSRARRHLEPRRDWPVVIGVNHVGRRSFHPDDGVACSEEQRAGCRPAALGSKGIAECGLPPLASRRSDQEANPTLLGETRDAIVAG